MLGAWLRWRVGANEVSTQRFEVLVHLGVIDVGYRCHPNAERVAVISAW
jgi:hypothetical protein